MTSGGRPPCFKKKPLSSTLGRGTDFEDNSFEEVFFLARASHFGSSITCFKFFFEEILIHEYYSFLISNE